MSLHYIISHSCFPGILSLGLAAQEAAARPSTNTQESQCFIVGDLQTYCFASSMDVLVGALAAAGKREEDG